MEVSTIMRKRSIGVKSISRQIVGMRNCRGNNKLGVLLQISTFCRFLFYFEIFPFLLILQLKTMTATKCPLSRNQYLYFSFDFFLSLFVAAPQIETDNKHQFWFVICCKFSKCRVTSNFIFDVHNVICTTAHALHIFCIWLQNSPRQIVFNIVVYFLVTFSVFHISALK